MTIHAVRALFGKSVAQDYEVHIPTFIEAGLCGVGVEGGVAVGREWGRETGEELLISHY